MQTLIVEDEKRVLEFLRSALVAEGHAVNTCPDLETLGAFIETKTIVPDLIILDRMLQGKDGIRMIAPAKRAFPEARILVLSAINSHDEKAAALDLGADDYMCKPFSLVELSARIRALTRRGGPETGRWIEAAGLRIDLLNRSVTTGSGTGTRKIELSNKEFQLLAVLAKNPGRVFDKYRLQNMIWDVQSEIESNVVEVTIRNLRKKLESPDSSVHIQSKRNVGYWLED